MAINFKQVPDQNPFALIPEGYYKGRITKAEMKAAKPSEKNPKPKPYLNVTIALTNAKGQKMGNFFDMFSESTNEIVLYKFGRFIKALGLMFTGDVELKDLAKVIVNKELCLEIVHQDDSRFPKDSGHKQAKVKVFGSECYWPASEFSKLVGDSGQLTEEAPAEGTEEDEPFNFTAEDGQEEASAEDEDL